jgi:hypothetical protein
MAGTIIADFIRTDANQLSLNVGNTTFATINAMGFLSNTGVQIISPTGAINAASIAAGSIPAGKLGAASVARTNMYSGAVLQVVSATKLDAFTTSSTSPVDVTGLSVNITPTSATSKILVLASIYCSAASTSGLYFNFVRNSTALAVGTSGGTVNSTSAVFTSNLEHFITIPSMFLDSPNTTSATVYKIQAFTTGSLGAVNRRANDTVVGGSSTITVMEIAA